MTNLSPTEEMRFREAFSATSKDAEEIMRWISENLRPEAVFSKEKLTIWAKDNLSAYDIDEYCDCDPDEL